MMFFFDSNYAYILAEATRTLSLLDDSVHEIEDGLWMGHSIIPRGFSVCEHTAELPANSGSNKDDASAGLVHIVNDLTGDVRFCDRPFVKGGPLARFYAGVPITTPRGINIGAYCIVDDKPRSGLDDKGIAFLTDMAATIMAHLEMVRSTSDHKRNTRMVAGLSAFVDGASDMREQDRNKKTSSNIVSRYASTAHRGTNPGVNPKKFPIVAGYTEPAPLEHTATSTTGPSSPVIETPPSDSVTGHEAVVKGPSHVHDVRAEKFASNVKATFKRVSGVVREAMEVDGATFLDASAPSYAELGDLNNDHSSSEHSSDSGQSTSESANADNSDSRSKNRTDRPEQDCYILGSSIASEHDQIATINRATIPESFLHAVLRKYPRGKIWNFNDEGDASSEEESSGSSTSEKAEKKTAKSLGLSSAAGDRMLRKRRRKRARIEDGREVQRLFPGVRSLAIIGMWDQIKGRWFAGCIVWTYSPMKLLSEDCELNFLTAFGDAIMAEVHRLEAQNSDKGKMDFISTISHELRSPLHGILGSVECLQEHSTDSEVDGLVSQVEVCGRTLLDIVDHLLEFSKINTYARVQKRRRSIDPGKIFGTTQEALSKAAAKMALEADVSLDAITEEVAETAFYSFCCSKEPQTILERNVAFVVDIDRSPGKHWRCRIDIGAWKRICINVISNALKYTSDGYVHVTLRCVPSRHRKKLNAVLTVSDTGRGMSDDFLRGQLFQPFTQEDSLVEGTGLGMSLVAKIVRALGGKVDVKSTKSLGTTVAVTVPLVSSNNEQGDTVFGNLAVPEGTSVGILDDSNDSPGPIAAVSGRALVISSLKRSCSEIGLLQRNIMASETGTPDIAVILESDFLLLQSGSKDQDRRKHFHQSSAKIDKIPWIVICNNAISERKLRATQHTHPSHNNLVFVSQPCSPARLANVTQSCLEQDQHDRDKRSSTFSIEADQSENGKTELEDVIEQLKAGTAPPASSQPKSGAKIHRRWSSDSLTPLLIEAPEIPFFRADSFEASELNSAVGLQTAESLLKTDSDSVKAGTTRFAEQKPNQRPPNGEVPDNNLCLLLVDDNQINLQLLVTYARKRRYRNHTASNGLEAVSTYKSAVSERYVLGDTYSGSTLCGKPHVVLMDINMPVLDGFEATRRIRQFEHEEKLERATIIALTGLGSTDAQQEAYSSGIDLFLTKPVRLKELTRILDAMKDSAGS